MLTERQQQVKDMLDRGMSTRGIAKEIGCGHANIDRIKRRLKTLGELEDSPGAIDAMQRLGIGPEMVRGGWLKDKDASIQFRAPREEEGDAFLERLTAALEDREPVTVPAPREACEKSLLALYGIWDVHLGLHSWARETGERYDIKEARKTALDGMQGLMGRTPDAEACIVLAGGDFTHADDERAETPTNKHSLDVDGRFYKMAEASLSLLFDLVELAASKHSRVIVRVLPGNHDPHASKWLSVALSHIFQGGRIEVIADPGEWLHYRHGRTLISAHHGHRRKMQDMAAAIPALCPKDWGETLFRYFFQGHVHHEKMGQEINGVFCRSMAPITPRDSYAASMGFQSGRSMSALIFHDRWGLYSEARQPILPPVEAA